MKLKNKEVFEESMLLADDFTRPCRLENCMFFIPTITYAQFTTEIITDKDKTGKNMAISQNLSNFSRHEHMR